MKTAKRTSSEVKPARDDRWECEECDARDEGACEPAAAAGTNAVELVLAALGYVPAAPIHADLAGYCRSGQADWLARQKPEACAAGVYKLTRAHIDADPSVRRVAEIAAAAWMQRHPETYPFLNLAPADEPQAVPSL